MNEVMVNEERGMAVRNSQTEMMVNRQAQEVQAALVIAKLQPDPEIMPEKITGRDSNLRISEGRGKSNRSFYPSGRGNGSELGQH